MDRGSETHRLFQILSFLEDGDKLHHIGLSVIFSMVLSINLNLTMLHLDAFCFGNSVSTNIHYLGEQGMLLGVLFDQVWRLYNFFHARIN